MMTESMQDTMNGMPALRQNKRTSAEKKERKIERHLANYRVALRSTEPETIMMVERCLKKFEKHGKEAVIKGKNELMEYYLEVLAEMKAEDKKRPKKQEMSDEFYEKLRYWRSHIFLLGGEILKLEGTFVELDMNSAIAIHASEICEDMVFVAQAKLVKDLSGSSDGYFGEYEYHPSYSIQLTPIEDMNVVQITKEDAQAIVDFFEVNNL